MKKRAPSKLAEPLLPSAPENGSAKEGAAAESGDVADTVLTGVKELLRRLREPLVIMLLYFHLTVAQHCLASLFCSKRDFCSPMRFAISLSRCLSHSPTLSLYLSIYLSLSLPL
jgi:hypothetical protein